MTILKLDGESYRHACARGVVVGWLRTAGGYLGGISWDVNRGPPGFGIWNEYPLTPWLYRNFPMVWDEVLDNPWDGVEPGPSPFDHPLWPRRMLMRRQPIPTYEELVSVGDVPLAIVDVAVQHKGSIIAVVEIVASHDLTPQKIATLMAFNVDIWRVDADWVLRQTGMPKEFPNWAWQQVRTTRQDLVQLKQKLVQQWEAKVAKTYERPTIDVRKETPSYVEREYTRHTTYDGIVGLMSTNDTPRRETNDPSLLALRNWQLGTWPIQPVSPPDMRASDKVWAFAELVPPVYNGVICHTWGTTRDGGTCIDVDADALKDWLLEQRPDLPADFIDEVLDALQMFADDSDWPQADFDMCDCEECQEDRHEDVMDWDYEAELDHAST
jgi:hypothetical protein